MTLPTEPPAQAAVSRPAPPAAPAPAPDCGQSTTSGTKPRRLGLLAAALTLALLGAANLAAAALTRTPAPQADDAGGTPAASASRTAPANATRERSAPSASASAPALVSELADPRWVAATAAAAGIPERALGAYAGAALAVASTHPSCHLGWNTLAGIGHVETGHGAAGGAVLGDDGVAAPAIIGPQLRGEGTAKVSDTDGGVLDGDPEWDRAVGPMQFLPATWAAHAQDGDRDGRADIND
ncbi:MAG: hypothetical protein LBL01_06260, partial [Bifidobacteriaceae bacterium]|nr:hypothetical protein [Bifidobacteriaceae bacterium]